VSRQGWVNGLHYAPNALAPRDAGLDALRAAADLVRVGLAGSLRDYRLVARDGREVPLSSIDYNGQPAGYVAQPGDVVNYVENHDNQTLYDVNVFKLPRDTSPEDRARVQALALATVTFSQGIAYFHAGGEILRSKSMDRNSFDSGDWFNRVDWSGRENAFGSGLPPASDNQRSWPLMRPLLADPSLRPQRAPALPGRRAFAVGFAAGRPAGWRRLSGCALRGGALRAQRRPAHADRDPARGSRPRLAPAPGARRGHRRPPARAGALRHRQRDLQRAAAHCGGVGAERRRAVNAGPRAPATVLHVQVKPNARAARLEQDADGGRCAHLASPPVDGKANAELIGQVAERFGVPKSRVRIARGAGSRYKRVEIG